MPRDTLKKVDPGDKRLVYKRETTARNAITGDEIFTIALVKQKEIGSKSFTAKLWVGSLKSKPLETRKTCRQAGATLFQWINDRIAKTLKCGLHELDLEVSDWSSQ